MKSAVDLSLPCTSNWTLPEALSTTLKTIKLMLDQQLGCVACSTNKQLNKWTRVMYLFEFAQIMFPIHDRWYCCQDAVDRRLREMTVSFGVPLTFLAILVSFLKKKLPASPPFKVLSSYYVISRYCFSYSTFILTSLVRWKYYSLPVFSKSCGY